MNLKTKKKIFMWVYYPFVLFLSIFLCVVFFDGINATIGAIFGAFWFLKKSLFSFLFEKSQNDNN